ncbi:MAG: hypothetical protein LBG16_01305 [Elusimicrobiota bacterium]|jgi:hypothetical protein|nr:hypothetical protein [Elusimicrobiota bacterium]
MKSLFLPFGVLICLSTALYSQEAKKEVSAGLNATFKKTKAASVENSADKPSRQAKS